MTDREVYGLLKKIDDGYEPTIQEELALSNIKEIAWHRTYPEELPESIGYLTNLQILDLSYMRIKNLPESIGNLTNLHILDLCYAQTTTLPESIGNLTNLQVLDMSISKISELPESIGNLTSLQSLKLSASEINELPESIGELTSLESLYLNYTKISTLPESIGKLTNLKHLFMIQMHIRVLPESIGNLISLQILNLSETQIRVMPESIGNLTSLQSLYLRSAQIGALPESIGKLKSLRSLDLCDTYFLTSTLPESIGKLTSLDSLNLSGARISKLPESIGELTNLEKLYLSYSKIVALPESIGNLISLQILDLRSTQISELPKSVGKLTSLDSLNLSGARISKLPESIGELTNLEKLYLSYSKIVALPESIGNLISLQILDLRSAQISELPESIGGLTSLQSLEFNDVGIKSLPESIGKLINLYSLDLRGTQISELPESVGKLKNLHSLDLRKTQINSLPEALGDLAALKYLILEDITLVELPESLLKLNLNYWDIAYSHYFSREGIYINGLKLQNQPVDLFKQSRELIVEYYKSIKDKQTLPINECKVVFLGDGGVGKSLIIDRLMNDGTISPEFDGESTPGICINSKKYQIGDEEIELHFWDFGGQAIMHSMHRLFLTNRTLYVVVANARDNKANEQAWYWIRNIKSFANNAPVFLLINQKDQNPSANVNVNGLCKEYAELKEVRIVSALKDSKEEFDRDIRNVICQIVSDMETVHTPFSRSWLSLMNDLQEMEEDYITSSVFYTKCSLNHVENKPDILDQIISWYQDLGVCFYSKAHPVSARYMVLKPRWLLNALYILAFNGRKYAVNGIIREKDLYTLICEEAQGDAVKKVWSDITYKPDEIQYILNVLLNYELIYSLDKDHLFIPMLCDDNEPKEIDFINSGEAFHVIFEYTYLPENVIHLLMVRRGYELNTDTVWRTGAVFKRKRCGWSSLVRIKEGYLDIYAKSDDQRIHPVNSYLDMMRDAIYKVNNDLGIAATEYIAYRKDGLEDRFDHDILVGSKEAGQLTIYSKVFKRLINIDEILGIVSVPINGRANYRMIDSKVELIGKPTVFISYNWGSDTTAEEVEKRLKPIAEVLRDKNTIGPWGSIKGFMKQIRKSDLVVVIVSDSYLKSVACLYEIMQLLKDEDWISHSMFLVEDSAKGIYKPIGQLQYINYWKSERDSLKKALDGMDPALVTAQADELNKITRIQLNINDFMKNVAERNNPDIGLAIDAVVRRVQNNYRESNVESDKR